MALSDGQGHPDANAERQQIVASGSSAHRNGIGQLARHWNAVIGGSPALDVAFFEHPSSPVNGVRIFVREFSVGSEGVMACVALKGTTRVVMALVAFGKGTQLTRATAQQEAVARAGRRITDL